MMYTALRKIDSQNACVITGILQWNAQKPIQDYLDTVTGNNFMPLLILPTKVTSKSSKLD